MIVLYAIHCHEKILYKCRVVNLNTLLLHGGDYIWEQSKTTNQICLVTFDAKLMIDLK
jgi:hypothetical protein